MRAARGDSRTGFTLLEALLALVLMITLLSGVYGFYATTLRVREDGGKVARDALLAHALLDRIGEEIRHSTDLVPGDGVGFGGTHDRLTLVRAAMPELYCFDQHDAMREDLPPVQFDLRRITYELIWDEELIDAEGVKICHGLLRSEQRSFDPNPRFVVQAAEEGSADLGAEGEPPKPQPGGAMPVERELIAPEIKYLRIEYFDGAEWRDRWQTVEEQIGEADPTGGALGGGEHALPQAVRITVGQVRVPPEDEELNITQLKKMEERQKKQEYHRDRFTVVIYLQQADQSLLSSRKYGVKNDVDLQLGGEEMGE